MQGTDHNAISSAKAKHNWQRENQMNKNGMRDISLTIVLLK
jgi:hypothetical protein